MEQNNVTIIWNGKERSFENVKDLERGKGYVYFTDGNIRRFFADVPYDEVESFYPDDNPDLLPNDAIK